MDKNLAALQRAREEFLYLAHKPANFDLQVGERTLREIVAHFLAADVTTLAALVTGLSPTAKAAEELNSKASQLWENEQLLRDYRQVSGLLFRTYQHLAKEGRLADLLSTAIDKDLAHYQEHLVELRRALGM